MQSRANHECFYPARQIFRILRDAMTFNCQKCGECCSSMGEIIEIRDRTGADSFRILFTATGEERLVTIDPDKHDLFFGTPVRSAMTCPFLRGAPDGTVLCTVHLSRPDLCRQYGCFRILILDKDGCRAGLVTDRSRYFRAMNPEAHSVWEDRCRTLTIPDETLWEEEIERIFTREGYQVIR